MTRHERLNQREQELIRAIEELQAEYANKATPIARELSDLRDHRDRRRFRHDGVEYEYTGPLPPYLLPEERD